MQIDDAFLDWFVGFIEGEGNFGIRAIIDKGHHKQNQRGTSRLKFTPSFKIAITDKATIEDIHRKLDFGYTREQSKEVWTERSPRASNQYNFYINSVCDAQRFINLVSPDRFRTRKKNDYILWIEGFEIIKKREHLTYDGAMRLFTIRDLMNKSNGKGKPSTYRTAAWGKKFLDEHMDVFSPQKLKLRMIMCKAVRKKEE
jgi:hypothetical protein